jgi:hypothetical protein
MEILAGNRRKLQSGNILAEFLDTQIKVYEMS